MKHRFAQLSVTLVVIVAMTIPSLAHPGRTDAKGGHTNRSTGEYHYHHGYPEHQHPGGKCPYDFDDKTGENSWKNSGNSSKSKKESNAEKKTIVVTPEPKPSSKLLSILNRIGKLCAILFIALYVFFFALAVIVGPLFWIWGKIKDIIRSIRK